MRTPSVTEERQESRPTLGLTKGNKMDRKAIIREYKSTPRPMGVYQIKNRINGKVLIGSSKIYQEYSIVLDLNLNWVAVAI